MTRRRRCEPSSPRSRIEEDRRSRAIRRISMQPAEAGAAPRHRHSLLHFLQPLLGRKIQDCGKRDPASTRFTLQAGLSIERRYCPKDRSNRSSLYISLTLSNLRKTRSETHPPPCYFPDEDTCIPRWHFRNYTFIALQSRHLPRNWHCFFELLFPPHARESARETIASPEQPT